MEEEEKEEGKVLSRFAGAHQPLFPSRYTSPFFAVSPVLLIYSTICLSSSGYYGLLSNAGLASDLGPSIRGALTIFFCGGRVQDVWDGFKRLLKSLDGWRCVVKRVGRALVVIWEEI